MCVYIYCFLGSRFFGLRPSLTETSWINKTKQTNPKTQTSLLFLSLTNHQQTFSVQGFEHELALTLAVLTTILGLLFHPSRSTKLQLPQFPLRFSLVRLLRFANCDSSALAFADSQDYRVSFDSAVNFVTSLSFPVILLISEIA